MSYLSDYLDLRPHLAPVAEEYALYVKRGAGIMNEYMPDWRSRVEILTLDLANELKCVLGQVFHSYANGLDTLVDPADREHGFTWGAQHGFDRPRLSRGTFQLLTALWKDEIENG